MDSEVVTLGVLAIVVAGGWLIDVLSHRSPSPLQRQMVNQIKKSADTIRGASLR
ncbi:hypothetical protein QTH87_13620 [Variovorax sp. J22P168]|uniref:hypothetical protein n=1 Tax=Variovorax jilinensis TaxID=3053513 RepID=UPI0025783545|nr:hypothetical protein [Variovorax sp. J22P168]MDM0013475.1 hypothetical protein [Variovorax sp. J22P168]